MLMDAGIEKFRHATCPSQHRTLAPAGESLSVARGIDGIGDRGKVDRPGIGDGEDVVKAQRRVTGEVAVHFLLVNQRRA